MNLEIEPGCLAILINCNLPENNGKNVITLRFVGKIKGCKHKDLWEIDRPISCLKKSFIAGEEIISVGEWNYAQECHLMRIGDSHPEIALEEKSDEEILQILKDNGFFDT